MSRHVHVGVFDFLVLLALGAAADGAGDHHTGVDPDADAKLPAEPLGDEAVNRNSGGKRRPVFRGKPDDPQLPFPTLTAA